MVGLIVLVTVLTSVLSGALGVGGGMILMGFLAAVLPAAQAFVWHGVIQLMANGSRAWWLRRDIQWQVVGGYLCGVGMVLALFFWQRWLVSTWIIFLLLGLSPLVRYLPRLHLSVESRGGALLCGLLVTLAQLLAGASGPILDLFFVDSRLDRHAIVATKAFTQSLGHCAKVLYFVTFASIDAETAAIVFLVACCAPLGTLVGKRILGMLSNRSFRTASLWLTHGIAAIYLGKAAMELW